VVLNWQRPSLAFNKVSKLQSCGVHREDGRRKGRVLSIKKREDSPWRCFFQWCYKALYTASAEKAEGT